METDIGNPIEYKPDIDLMPADKDNGNEGDNFYYDESEPQHHPQMMYMQPPPPPPPPPPPIMPNSDLFSNMDKNMIVIAFAVFLLGFFMGKTMQPVILRYT